MRNRLLILFLLAPWWCAGESAPGAAAKRLQVVTSVLADAYPKAFEGSKTDASGAVVLRVGGKDFVYDDGKEKTFDALLNAPDVEDMFAQSYPLTNPTTTLPVNFDPGRVRVEAFFKALFGGSESEVTSSCVNVDFCGHKVRFNARHGAADALAAVGKELDALFAKKPALRDYVSELGGTFAWRTIAGTKRLSNHSFATAIDLNVSKSAYWRWGSPALLAKFTRDNWPTEIIETFERHGFIWGGKWWHYDTMHFEFRPDLIAFSRKLPAPPKPGPSGEEGKADPKSATPEKFERPEKFK